MVDFPRMTVLAATIATLTASLAACGGGGSSAEDAVAVADRTHRSTSTASTTTSAAATTSTSTAATTTATASVSGTTGCGAIADSAARGTIGQPHGVQSNNTVVDIVNPDQSLYTNTVGANTITVNVNPGTSAKVTANLYCYSDSGAVNPTAVASTTVAVSGSNAALGIPVTIPFKGMYQLELTVTNASTGATIGSPKVTTYTAFAANTPDKTTQFAISSHAANCQGCSVNGITFARHLDANMSLMAKAGFARVRDNFYWINIENPRYTYAPHGYDSFVNSANSYGLSIMGILGYTNSQINVNGLPSNYNDIMAFAYYGRSLAGAYGNQVESWEVYNEAPVSVMARYTDITKPTFDQIKAVAPNANVAACSGTVLPGMGDGGAMGTCLQALHVTVAPDKEDTWTTHPYMAPAAPDIGFVSTGSPLGNHFSVDTVAAYELTLASQNGNPKVWWSELGWYSSGAQSSGDAFVDERAQAAYIARMYLTLRKYPGIGAAFIYDFQDDGTDLTNTENNFGLIRADFSPKPSYVAMSVMANSLGNKAFTSALMDTSTARVYQYGGTGVGSVIAGWTTYVNAFNTYQTATVAVPSGTYTLRSWSGGESTVTITGNSYTWNVGPLPQYLIRKS